MPISAVCPGPIWTPLVIATMGKDSLEDFGPSSKVPPIWHILTYTDLTAPIGRAGQPVEVATAFVFLASVDSSYFTAQASQGHNNKLLVTITDSSVLPCQRWCCVLNSRKLEEE